ncbi:chalcone isomerase family protein [Uliginosibacterium aquaticum]|uniref:Chalcone isomerase family protein n=1 Tax=Uliginosibacterium aquaticum TaxID=2731212 RepID=A0ABX2IP80_9RHOO|nr:chalcone isomerase family protein [Uliginosibacterium aquaticum]NSL56499.1 chalcone isomerase family protein [Uliginosibacterium aquaticum]
MLRVLCLLLISLFAGSVFALPEAARQNAPDWRALGQGEMRWFGLRLYGAELWVRGAGWSREGPFALKLTYARDIPGGRIVDASVDELRRLGYRDEVQLVRWREHMTRAFPDVRAGDSITGVFLPGRGVQFWFGEQLRAEVTDLEFARAFFDIWLDPRTREPALRERLLGLRG